MRVFIFDLDETLLVFNDLVNGKFAHACGKVTIHRSNYAMWKLANRENIERGLALVFAEWDGASSPF